MSTTATDRGVVTNAIKQSFNEVGEVFFATELINRVRRITGRREFDSTILRILRRIRQNDPQNYDFVCINNKQAIYSKLSIKLNNNQKN